VVALGCDVLSPICNYDLTRPLIRSWYGEVIYQRFPGECLCNSIKIMSNTLRSLFLVCALGWAGVIFYLSHIPGVDVPPLFFGKDKLFHAIAYSILGFFAIGSMITAESRHRMFRPWLAIGLVIAYGVLDEFHQHFVPGRTPDIYDVLADAAGGLLGVWLFCRFVSSRLDSRANRPEPAASD